MIMYVLRIMNRCGSVFWFGYRLVSPVDEDFEYSYWEQMIWYVNYCGCDLKKAEETWYEKEWNKKYLIGNE